MLNIEEIGLIEPYDEAPPQHCLFTLVRQGQRLEAPITQPTSTHIVLLTLLLGAIATPLCLFIYGALRPSEPRLAIGLLFCAIWLLAVLGPAAFWVFVPIGWLRPDHWIRFDRGTGILSIRGGYAEFRRDEIVAFLSVTDCRKKKRQTELQVITGSVTSFSKHFVANCRELNPSLAFATVMQELGEFSEIAYWFAVIDEDGKVALNQRMASDTTNVLGRSLTEQTAIENSSGQR